MSLLLYCICETASHAAPPSPPGVKGKPVRLIPHEGLCAVVSPLPAPVWPLAWDIPSLLAFENVVELFHREQAVLPARYGTVLAGETQVRQLLDRGREAYVSALTSLNECVEMGIRIMRESAQEQDPPTASPASTGAAYLRWRSRCYAERDADSHGDLRLLDEVRRAFEGLFVRCQAKSTLAANPLLRAPILSLEFLVRCDCENAFRKRFRALSGTRREKLLLSGPWPPYSFVPTSPGR